MRRPLCKRPSAAPRQLSAGVPRRPTPRAGTAAERPSAFGAQTWQVGDALLGVDGELLGAEDAAAKRERVSALLQSPSAKLRLTVARPSSSPRTFELPGPSPGGGEEAAAVRLQAIRRGSAARAEVAAMRVLAADAAAGPAAAEPEVDPASSFRSERSLAV